MNEFKKQISKCVEDALNQYGLVIALLIIGYILGWSARYLLSDKKYFKQLEIRLKEKDQKIDEYKLLISERLAKIEVKKEDASFFKKVKKFFKIKLK